MCRSSNIILFVYQVPPIIDWKYFTSSSEQKYHSFVDQPKAARTFTLSPAILSPSWQFINIFFNYPPKQTKKVKFRRIGCLGLQGVKLCSSLSRFLISCTFSWPPPIRIYTSFLKTFRKWASIFGTPFSTPAPQLQSCLPDFSTKTRSTGRIPGRYWALTKVQYYSLLLPDVWYGW